MGGKRGETGYPASFHSISSRLRCAGIELILGSPVVSADLAGKKLTTEAGAVISYSNLIIATGSDVSHSAWSDAVSVLAIRDCGWVRDLWRVNSSSHSSGIE